MTTNRGFTKDITSAERTKYLDQLEQSLKTAEGMSQGKKAILDAVIAYSRDKLVNPYFYNYWTAKRFYVGKILTGILMLLTFGGFGIWYIYDYFSIPCKNFTDSQGRYLECQRNQAFPIIMTCLFTFIVLFYVSIFILISMIGFTKLNLEDVVRNQVTAIQENHLNKAYSYEASDTVSENDFNEFIKQHPEFSNSKTVEFPQGSPYNKYEKKSAKLEAQLISPTGEKTTVHYEFKKQDKEWKIVKTETSQSSNSENKSGSSE